MPIVEQFQEFLTRKRSWKFLACAFALAVVGHMLEGVPMLETLRTITGSLKSGLLAVQPFAIADIIYESSVGHSGLWFCAPVGASAFDPNRCSGLFYLINMAFAAVIGLPEVAMTVWEQGGLINGAVFVVTIGVIGLLVAGGIAEGASTRTPYQAGVGVIVMILVGPWVAGAIFWLLLMLLYVLVFLFGEVLAWIAWLIVTFAGVYKVAAFGLGVVKSADSMQDTHKLLTGGRPDAPPAPPRPPPAPPPAQ